jgi:hypothetical protein
MNTRFAPNEAETVASAIADAPCSPIRQRPPYANRFGASAEGGGPKPRMPGSIGSWT